MTTTHTPGPWKLTIDHEINFVGVTTADGKCLFEDMPEPQHIANARLIAAAPVLLAACKELTPLGDMHTKDEWADSFVRLELAISQAEPDPFQEAKEKMLKNKG